MSKEKTTTKDIHIYWKEYKIKAYIIELQNEKDVFLIIEKKYQHSVNSKLQNLIEMNRFQLL